MTTTTQIQANRDNAQLSTGPRTPEGKSVVKWNAFRHGLLSREVVIQAGEGKESKAEFRTFFRLLWDNLQPEGPLEEILVERIAVCYWRLRRVLRCEIGEIRKKLDAASWRELFARADQVCEARKSLILNESKQTLKKNSFGLQYLIEFLEEVKSEVEEEGHVSERTQERLSDHFGDDENGIASWCFVFSRMAREGPGGPEDNTNRPSDTPSPEKCKEMILKLIDEEKKKMEGLKAIVEENEGLEADARSASYVLPPKETADKILRYETTIERQLYRALNQLERLQRQRRGEVVPPPISVEVAAYTPA